MLRAKPYRYNAWAAVMKRKNNNTSNIALLVIVFSIFIIAFIGLNAGSWNWGAPKPVKKTAAETTPPVIQPTDATQNPNDNGWQAYTNTDYAFQINYPDSFSAPTQPFNTSPVTFGESGVSIQQLHKNGVNFDDSVLSNKSGICLIGANNPSALPVFFYYKDIESINGTTAYHYVNYPNINARFCTDASACFYYDIYRVSRGNQCYEIIYQRNGGPVTIPDNIAAMLATLHFTQ